VSYTETNYASADCTGPSTPSLITNIPNAPNTYCSVGGNGDSFLSPYCDMSGTAPRLKGYHYSASSDCTGSSYWYDFLADGTCIAKGDGTWILRQCGYLSPLPPPVPPLLYVPVPRSPPPPPVGGADSGSGDAGSARASDLSGSPRAHTVAACLVGELRSIDLTGPSIRRFLLDEYEADAFVVALRHKDQGAEESMRRLVLALGNLVAVKVGTAEELLDPDLRRASIASPGQRNGYVGQGEVGHGDWPRKHTDQWLNRRLCRDLVLSHESRRGKPYNAYVRMRLDTQLFAPLPMGSFEFAAAASQHAVIPEGNDFGACEECSITDKMLLGGAAAFTADAQVHETMIANTLAELRNT
jgi:hypothetical protein